MAGINAPIDTTTSLVVLGLIVAAFIVVLALDERRRERDRQRRERQLDSVHNARARRERGD